MRSGLLKKFTFADALLNQLVANLSDAINTLTGDDDVLMAPVSTLVASGAIQAGKSVVCYQGAPGATLTLPPANALGANVAAVIQLFNAATGVITIRPSGGGTINGAVSVSVGAGQLVTLVSDGGQRWASTAPAPPYDVIASAAFSSVSSRSFSWTAGKYRRLEVHLRVTASGAGDVTLTLTGLGGVYSSWSTYNQKATSTWGVGSFPATWVFGNGAYVGQTDAQLQIATGAVRSFQADTLDATNGYLLLSRGSNTDTASAVSGISLTFPGATSGWIDLYGYV